MKIDLISKSFNFFDAIYCINLEFRNDRWESAIKEFEKIGIAKKIVKFRAIYTPENGSIGCLLSHREIIKMAQVNKWKNVLVFEDDIKILEQNIYYLIKSLEQLKNEKWDLFYLGGTFIPFDFPVIIEDNNLCQISGGRGGHAIAYNKSIYQKILNETGDVNHFIRKHRALDLYLSRFVQSKYRALITKKTIFTQKAGVSDINKKFRNWEDYIVEKFEYYKSLPFWIKKRNRIFQKVLPIIWLMQCLLIPKIRVVNHDKEPQVR